MADERGGSLSDDKVGARAHSSFDLDSGANYVWTARVRGEVDNRATAYTRNLSANQL